MNCKNVSSITLQSALHDYFKLKNVSLSVSLFCLLKLDYKNAYKLSQTSTVRLLLKSLNCVKIFWVQYHELRVVGRLRGFSIVHVAEKA